jgi:uncharacterized membrane protein HdeD (DUF308 family)
MTSALAAQLSNRWWTFLVRGVLALMLSAFAFLAPGITLVSLVFVFGAYFIISGVVTLYTSLSFGGGGHLWAYLLLGILQVLLGGIVFFEPGVGALSLAFLFAIWTIVTGINEISMGLSLRDHLPDEILTILLGVITLGFGLYVSIFPGLGLVTLVYLVGFYAAFAGIALIALAFRLNTVRKKLSAAHGA